MRKHLALFIIAIELPLWAQTIDFSSVVKKASPAIFLVGTENQEHGTAFVISKKHRLLVTNAHVADLSKRDGIIAFQNKKSRMHRVKEVYYHPRITRQIGINQVIEGFTSQIGKVFVSSPDIAILELEGNEELEHELELAPYQELLDLDQGQPVAMIGFPGRDTKGVPEGEEKPVLSSFFRGDVNRVTDFYDLPSETPEGAQKIQHSMGINDTRGLSGAPILNAAGKVVAVNNHTRTLVNTTSILAQPDTVLYGVRADCIWEAVAASGMEEAIPLPVPKEKLNLADRAERTEEQTAFVKAYNKAVLSYALAERADAENAIEEFIKKYPEVAMGHQLFAEITLRAANDALYQWIISSEQKDKDEAKIKELYSLEKSQKHYQEYERLWGQSQETSLSLVGIKMRIKAAKDGITDSDRTAFTQELREILGRVFHKGYETLGKALMLEQQFLVSDPKERVAFWERNKETAEYLDTYLYQAANLSSVDPEKAIDLARRWHTYLHVEIELERALRAMSLEQPPGDAVLTIYRAVRELDPEDIRPSAEVHYRIMGLAFIMGDWKRAEKHALKVFRFLDNIRTPVSDIRNLAYLVDLKWHLLNDFNDYYARFEFSFLSFGGFSESMVMNALENTTVTKIPMFCSSKDQKQMREEYHAFIFAKDKKHSLAFSRSANVPPETDSLPVKEFIGHPGNYLQATEGEKTIRLRAAMNWDTRSPSWVLRYDDSATNLYCISQ